MDEIHPNGMMTIEEKPFAAGGFGGIYRGLTNRGVKVAVKKSKASVKPEDIDSAWFEAALATTFDHVNILSLLCIVRQPNAAPWLIFPYMSNGSLHKTLHTTNDCTLERIQSDVSTNRLNSLNTNNTRCHYPYSVCCLYLGI